MRLQNKVAIVTGGGRWLGRPLPLPEIPNKGDIPRIFMNQEHRVPQTFFGNVNQEDFLEVRSKKTFLAFRKVFEDRRKAEIQPGRLVDAFTNIRSGSDSQVSKEPPPPLSELCRTCYKAYGI